MSVAERGGVVRAGEGQHFSFPPGNWGEVKADRSCGMRFGFFRTELPVGTGMPFLHVHHSMDEAFQIVEGSVEYRLGDRYQTVHAGDALLVPQGVPHCFRAVGEQPAILLLIVAPAEGIDMIVELSKPGLGDPERMGTTSPPTTASSSNPTRTGNQTNAHRRERGNARRAGQIEQTSAGRHDLPRLQHRAVIPGI